MCNLVIVGKFVYLAYNCLYGLSVLVQDKLL